MNYIQNLRTKIGHQKFIHPAARILIENEAGEFLFIQRIDNGKLGIPAGGLEEGETIEQCIIREVQEETGLELQGVEVIGISTNPQNETVTYPNGDMIQYFTVEFYSQQWTGTPKADNVETKAIQFLPFETYKKLPQNEQSAFRSFLHYQKTNQIRLS